MFINVFILHCISASICKLIRTSKERTKHLRYSATTGESRALAYREHATFIHAAFVPPGVLEGRDHTSKKSLGKIMKSKKEVSTVLITERAVPMHHPENATS